GSLDHGIGKRADLRDAVPRGGGLLFQAAEARVGSLGRGDQFRKDVPVCRGFRLQRRLLVRLVLIDDGSDQLLVERGDGESGGRAWFADRNRIGTRPGGGAAREGRQEQHRNQDGCEEQVHARSFRRLARAGAFGSLRHFQIILII